MNTLNRFFLKPAYRVTRYGDGFKLHRRFLWFFYRPVPGVFPRMAEVFWFIHDETGSNYASVELYPPGDFSTHLHAEVPFTCATGSGLIPTTGPKYDSVITGARISPALDENRHAAVSPEGPDYATIIAMTAALQAAMPDAGQVEPTPSTDTPLERDDASSAMHDSQSSAAYDSHDSGSSSCDCGSSDSGSSSCDSGSSSCDSGSCGGGDCQ